MKYKPHDYQTYATNFILTHPISAVLLDMGTGEPLRFEKSEIALVRLRVEF